MKKLLLLLLTVACCAACNDDNDEKTTYPPTNTSIVNGVFNSTNMQFLGTSKATHADGGVYTDAKARFEFAGTSEQLVLYMHATRFAAAMPPLEMRMHRFAYTPGTGASLSFRLDRLVPQVKLPSGDPAAGGYQWTDMPAYTLTEIEGHIDNTTCRVTFRCDVPRLGLYTVTFEGRLADLP